MRTNRVLVLSVGYPVGSGATLQFSVKAPGMPSRFPRVFARPPPPVAAVAVATVTVATVTVAAVTVAVAVAFVVEAHATADALRQAGSPADRTRTSRQKGASPQCCGSKGQGKGFGEQDWPGHRSSGFLELGRGSRRRCSSRARQCGARACRVGSPPFLAGHRHLSAATATAATAAAATAAAGCRRPHGGTAAGHRCALRRRQHYTRADAGSRATAGGAARGIEGKACRAQEEGLHSGSGLAPN